ncbi:glutamine amidotransferase, putative [Trichomonas vaginalis G3]|uniref:Glutamine amidotransferase, putative n=1 Tax=Trichomonas vaginalis (strain ATCC PRA-98 / G3) TaxID=412133 RepID=A2DZU1_TRIV3|nr:glutamine metabolic process [Trichomonas vaginalis G3]EAY14000.1 glutamine amidotransferase, putative [Trichomonas vaginalis G3]KAI5519566.1 glutamine metabolic process [Trichomonas vaginalis G3]|eukprot:XP_001326223.1 glutamine amidotransferase [Trichomonas vaginalis G3]
MDVNSFHHQCIDRLANGFAIDTMSPDGIIESIHKKEGSFVFGTQFHPEMFVVCSDSFLPVFSRLVTEGKKYLSSK